MQISVVRTFTLISTPGPEGSAANNASVSCEGAEDEEREDRARGVLHC